MLEIAVGGQLVLSTTRCERDQLLLRRPTCSTRVMNKISAFYQAAFILARYGNSAQVYGELVNEFADFCDARPWARNLLHPDRQFSF